MGNCPSESAAPQTPVDSHSTIDGPASRSGSNSWRALSVREASRDTDGAIRILRGAERPQLVYLDSEEGGSFEEPIMTRSTQVPPYELPNGISIQQANPHETASLFKQIFVDHLYFQNGISLPANALVIDGGANIGLFTLYVLQHHPTATVVAVEPAPETFQILQANAARFRTAILLNCALGRDDGTVPFTYFPNVTCASGLYDAEDLGRFENIARSLIAKSEKTLDALRGPQGRELLDYLVAERLKRQTMLVSVRSLNTLIDSTGIRHINLLKLDVEGKEYEVLQSIRSEHWAMIDQLVIEVHDAPLTLSPLEELLWKHDFEVTTVSDELHAEACKAMIYAKCRTHHS